MIIEADLNYLIYSSFFTPLLLSAVLIWFIVFYQKKKLANQLREKDLIIEKQKALEAERTRIAAEMHDDLGGGLTTIKFLGQKVMRKMDGEDREKVGKIVSHTQNLVSNMSEIIWAMNAGFDTYESLVAYTRRFASQYLEEHEIALDFKSPKEIEDFTLTGEKRRNIFLIVKEALHNTVKYAQATKVKIEFIPNGAIDIKIQDNGIGFPSEDSVLGNGLKNMKIRAGNLNGEVDYKNDNGAIVHIRIPKEDLVEESNIIKA